MAKNRDSEIFLQLDYRNTFQKRLNSFKKLVSQEFNQQQMANFCRMQRTQLSKVLNKQTHLNEDQFYLAAKFLQYDENEIQYLRLLHQYQRSSIRERKKELKQKLDIERNKSIRTEKLIRSKVLNPKTFEFSEYYLDPNIQLTHIFFSIKKYQKNPEEIRIKLDLSEEVFNDILQKLIKIKLIEFKGDKVEPLEDKLFLTWESFLLPAYHALAKLNAARRVQQLPAHKVKTLSTVFSCSVSEANQISSLLVKVYSDIEKLISECKNPDQVYQLSYDFFSWS